jgi:hypothetical protein
VLHALLLVDLVGVALGVAETGLAPRRPSAAAPTATRDFNRGELGMLYPLVVAGCGRCVSCLSRTADPGGRLLAVNTAAAARCATRTIRSSASILTSWWACARAITREQQFALDVGGFDRDGRLTTRVADAGVCVTEPAVWQCRHSHASRKPCMAPVLSVVAVRYCG